MKTGHAHPLARLRHLVDTFIRSEFEEASLRLALDDAAPLYRDAPEAQEIHDEGDRIVEAFISEVLPGTSEKARHLSGELIIMTMTSVGKELSETPRTNAEIAAFAVQMSDMLCAYLQNVERSEA